MSENQYRLLMIDLCSVLGRAKELLPAFPAAWQETFDEIKFAIRPHLRKEAGRA